MRKFVLSAAIAGSALALSACSGGAEDAEETAAEETAVEGDASADAGAEDTAVLDASTATAEALAGVDGVSGELAAAIVAGQPYASITDLDAVLMETLDDDAAAAVRERVFVPVDLNSASRDEIALIPGMTDRMIGEFLEYRPYEDLGEFDREIGKYVDEAEVARFRQYLTL